jgi:hypothetical protein
MRLVIGTVLILLGACGAENSGSPADSYTDVAVDTADASPCVAGQYWYRDQVCGPVSGGADAGDKGITMACTEMGDGKCYRSCTSDADCLEAGWTHCGELGLFAGNDVCTEKVKICKPTAKGVCGKVE